jgi:ABC-type multidrug transport system fused ATPase/permease subunit
MKVLKPYFFLFFYLKLRRRVQVLFLLIFALISHMLEIISLTSVLFFIDVILNINSYKNNYLLLLVNNFFNLNIDNQKLIITFLFLGLLIISTLAKLFFIYFSARVVWGINLDLTLKLYETILDKKISYFNKSNSSFLIAAFDKMNILSVTFQNFIDLIASITFCFFITLTLLLINYKVTLIIFISLVLFYLIFSLLFNTEIQKNANYINFLASKKFQFINETIKNVRDIHLYDSRNFFKKNFYNLFLPLKNLNQTNNLIAEYPKHLVSFFAIFTLILFSLYLIKTGQDLIKYLPIITLFIFGAQKLIPQINILFLSWVRLKFHYNISKDALNYLLSTENQLIKTEIDNLLLINEKKKLYLDQFFELRNISFSYDGYNTSILDGINFRFEVKKSYFIFGESGSGKSTLVDVIIGFLELKKGQIIIDGKTIVNEKLIKQWNKIFAYVPQKPFLCDDTILNNIIFSENLKNISSNDINKVNNILKLLNLHEFVSSLPNGIYTNIGEDASFLSGGQAQRIGIARALYKESQILILDEATNALDNKNESDIIKKIINYKKDNIIIMISHNKNNKIFFNYTLYLNNKNLILI